MSLCLRSTGAARALLSHRPHVLTAAFMTARYCSAASSSSSSTAATTSAPAGTAAEDGANVFSGPEDAKYASKIAHLLRRQVYKQGFQSSKPQLTEKEEELLRMWRETGNNPELRSTAGQQQQPAFSETGAMETQTTAWEGSGAMAAAAEAVKMSEATETAKKSAHEDDMPVNVAEAYGQTFRDVRPIDPKEKVEDKRRRLIFQSRYRGMVEMDLILGHFARCKLVSLDAALLDEYDTLLKQLDNDLFRWVIMNMARPPEIEAMRCFHELKAFVDAEREQLLKDL